MRKRFFMVMMGLLAAGALLGLDLANQGLAWQFFWSQTGEEEPLAQVRGMVEWVGNLTRPQPINDPLVPIHHKNEYPYGINTFLHQEAEAVKVEAQLKQIAEAGFGWIREEFAWEDIEIHGRGDFEDRRNVDAIGVVDAWAKYDRIVELAEKYGIRIQARLSNPPAWSQEPGVHDQTPPLDFQDYINFAVTTAERYRGRVRYFQIWNEPNIFPEWGTNPDGSPRAVNPEQYTELLCRTYEALKAVDPEIVVISGALAPTSELWGMNLTDFVFLQRMYDAGAEECFDVLSMQGYGLNSGPTDRRMRPVVVNVGRNQYIRDIMVKNGDPEKSIWISEAAWNPVPDSPEISNRLTFGQVTLEQAAQYMPLYYQRAREEWPWIGVINYWYFTQPSDVNKGASWYYFRMAEPDYSPEKPFYTTLPVYESMKAYIEAQMLTLYQGVHQLENHHAVLYRGEAQIVKADGAQFSDALETNTLEFVMQGTEARLRWQGGTIRVFCNGELITTFEETPGEWHSTTLYRELLPQTQTIRIESDTPVVLDSITIVDGRFVKWYPFAVVGVIAAGMLLYAILIGIRSNKNET
jgi:polysaccharide biosynthesis protein PslG